MVEEMEDKAVDVYWGGRYNVVPRDVPLCGFFNENCPDDTTSNYFWDIADFFYYIRLVEFL